MAKYLVTGGCGFIGSHVVPLLLKHGHEVLILDDLSTGKRSNIPSDVTVIVGDVGNAPTVIEAMAGVDGCVHLAAVASVERSREDWAGTHRANLTATINIFDAARRCRPGGAIPVVYASSAAVYGDNPDMPLKETAEARPLSAYGADKLGCELHARAAWVVHGIPTTGFRFFNVYGPRQDPKSPYSGVISIFMDMLTAGRKLHIHGDGKQVRDFVYVGDLVGYLVDAIEGQFTGARVFNVCTGNATSINRLAEITAAAVGRCSQIEHGPAREGDIRMSIGDPTSLITAFGRVCETSIEKGLRVTLDELYRKS
jgi:UDP-glucose 4-epimerase